jgi:hypothetical protein
MSVHNLIVGLGTMGKSTLARALAEDFQQRGVGVGVLDPNGEEWPADRVFSETEPFIAWAKQSRRCALFVDEGGETIGRGKRALANPWITTRSRHWGHLVFILAHRATQIERTIRSNCGTLYCFQQPPGDAEQLADDYNCPALLTAPGLARGEFILARPGDPPRRMKLKLGA